MRSSSDMLASAFSAATSSSPVTSAVLHEDCTAAGGLVLGMRVGGERAGPGDVTMAEPRTGSTRFPTKFSTKFCVITLYELVEAVSCLTNAKILLKFFLRRRLRRRIKQKNDGKKMRAILTRGYPRINRCVVCQRDLL